MIKKTLTILLLSLYPLVGRSQPILLILDYDVNTGKYCSNLDLVKNSFKNCLYRGKPIFLLSEAGSLAYFSTDAMKDKKYQLIGKVSRVGRSNCKIKFELKDSNLKLVPSLIHHTYAAPPDAITDWVKWVQVMIIGDVLYYWKKAEQKPHVGVHPVDCSGIINAMSKKQASATFANFPDDLNEHPGLNEILTFEKITNEHGDQLMSIANDKEVEASLMVGQKQGNVKTTFQFNESDVSMKKLMDELWKSIR